MPTTDPTLDVSIPFKVDTVVDAAMYLLTPDWFDQHHFTPPDGNISDTESKSDTPPKKTKSSKKQSSSSEPGSESESSVAPLIRQKPFQSPSPPINKPVTNIESSKKH